MLDVGHAIGLNTFFVHLRAWYMSLNPSRFLPRPPPDCQWNHQMGQPGPVNKTSMCAVHTVLAILEKFEISILDTSVPNSINVFKIWVPRKLRLRAVSHV